MLTPESALADCRMWLEVVSGPSFKRAKPECHANTPKKSAEIFLNNIFWAAPGLSMHCYDTSVVELEFIRFFRGIRLESRFYDRCAQAS
jgi:hypothetical protein